jgi:hypothetical protein
MEDDRTLDELAAGLLDDVDATTLADLRAVLDQTDPVPDDLVDRVRFSLALDEVFEEVARMTRVPLEALAVRGEQAAGTRTETLTFSADRLTAMVTVSRLGADGLRLDGWLAPPEACRVRLRLQDQEPLETVVDESGRFSFAGLGEGFGQLSFHPADDEAPENAVVTPLFQL